MTTYIFKIITLLGGLALFLFGMDVMGKALERQAGGRLQTILAKMSSNVFKGFLLGLGVTAVIQSSSGIVYRSGHHWTCISWTCRARRLTSSRFLSVASSSMGTSLSICGFAAPYSFASIYPSDSI